MNLNITLQKNSLNNNSNNRDSDKEIRPFLRWAGGKKWLVKRLNETLDIKAYTSYHEPFVGGGAMLFYFRPPKAYISDANAQLMLTYKTVRDNIQEVIDTICSFGKGEQAYYAVRAIETEDPVMLTARFIYLNQMSYNGNSSLNI